MGEWGRRIGAVVAGLIVAVLIIMAVQAVSGALYPAPPDLDFTDREAVAAYARQLPIGALLIVALSYLLGSLAAGATVGRLARDRHTWLGVVAGVVLTLAGFMNLAAIPHPVWFAVITTVTYIPSAWLGVRLARGGHTG